MALETGTYISDLVTTNPATGDNADKGVDHLQLIKSTVKATFPNVTGAVTPTHTELNYVTGVTSAIQTQLAAKLTATNAAGAATTLSAARFQVYACTTAGVTVGLPTSPTAGDCVIIANAGATAITVDAGSGKTIANSTQTASLSGNRFTIYVYNNNDWISRVN